MALVCASGFTALTRTPFLSTEIVVFARRVFSYKLQERANPIAGRPLNEKDNACLWLM